MEVRIIRGEGQIGGNIVEVSTLQTRIILDVGKELTEGDSPATPPVKGLFEKAEYDAVLISHYHSDHEGLAAFIHKDIPNLYG